MSSYLKKRVNMWRSLENRSLVDKYPINIEIKVTGPAADVDWNDVVKFIDLLTNNRLRVNANIKDAQTVLGACFSAVYKEGYDSEFLKDIIFTPTGIDYKGRHPYVPNTFLYDYFFFPQYAKDIYEDVGAVAYRAHFKDHWFLGIYCEI
ncbi:hypothetical protein [[Flexibacter] sp. ATCC 35208]|uniref:hypothetical protein n=1 Tax=[Flexibacter] sp. ATCC 35208 TaxID=1936242 RepID=UPI00117F80E5|nr:hypothetical protein [[Flexibacter] sp. ATCC 35208]